MITFTQHFSLNHTPTEIAMMEKGCIRHGWTGKKIKYDTEGNPMPILEDVLDAEGAVIGQRTIGTVMEDETWQEYFNGILYLFHKSFIEYTAKQEEELQGKLNYNAEEKVKQMMEAITYSITVE